MLLPQISGPLSPAIDDGRLLSARRGSQVSGRKSDDRLIPTVNRGGLEELDPRVWSIIGH